MKATVVTTTVDLRAADFTGAGAPSCSETSPFCPNIEVTPENDEVWIALKEMWAKCR